MNSRQFLSGTIVGITCVIAGMLVAQDPLAAPEWQYKVVDMSELRFSLQNEPPFEKLWADHIAKQGAGGWELAAYTQRIAIYKKKAAQ